MKVITEKALQAQVDRLNKITNSPLKPYELKDGKYIAQVGNYYLDGAYGGWQLARMMSEGGSESLWRYCERKKINYSYSVSDVARKKDL